MHVVMRYFLVDPIGLANVGGGGHDAGRCPVGRIARVQLVLMRQLVADL